VKFLFATADSKRSRDRFVGFKRDTIAIEMNAVRDGGLSKQTLPRRKFTLEEDMKLRTLVESLGTKSWEEIARFIPERSARQCRDRYKNYLLESLVTEPWTPEEDALVVQKYHQIGPMWVEIGKMLSGRSGNNVKNRWHKHLCKLDEPMPHVRFHKETQRTVEQIQTAEAAAMVEEKPAVSFSQPICVGDYDWPHLFNAIENPFAIANGLSSGFPFGDSLF
jgi:hypothetical protein